MGKPKKCISIEQAKVLQKTWVEHRGKVMEQRPGEKLEVRDFWYSVEELQEYLDFVKEQSQAQGVKNPGIRIFLGAYPENHEKNGENTLFLAATQETAALTEAGEEEVVQETNYEIDPMNLTQGGYPPMEY